MSNKNKTLRHTLGHLGMDGKSLEFLRSWKQSDRWNLDQTERDQQENTWSSFRGEDRTNFNQEKNRKIVVTFPPSVLNVEYCIIYHTVLQVIGKSKDFWFSCSEWTCTTFQSDGSSYSSLLTRNHFLVQGRFDTSVIFYGRFLSRIVDILKRSFPVHWLWRHVDWLLLYQISIPSSNTPVRLLAGLPGAPVTCPAFWAAGQHSQQDKIFTSPIKNKTFSILVFRPSNWINKSFFPPNHLLWRWSHLMDWMNIWKL